MTNTQSLIHWLSMMGYLFDYFKGTERYFFSYYQNIILKYQNLFFHSVQFRCSVMSESLSLHGLHHVRTPCPSQTPRVYSNSYPLSQWWHPTIPSSVVPFSSCLQSFPASVSQFFTSGGQSIGVSASASVLPVNIQDWFPVAWSGWISLQSKGQA